MRNLGLFGFSVRRLVILILAGGAVIAGAPSASADIPRGRLNRDLTVGANHDVQLKANQMVQIMKDAGGKAVIMVALPDGSNGVFQIEAAAVDLVAAPPAAPVAAPAAPRPVSSVKAAPAPAPVAPPSLVYTTTPPTYPNDFVGGSQVSTTAGKRAAGTASIVTLKAGTQSYIVSARHLLGPEGGFEKQTPAAKVPDFVKSIEIESFAGGRQRYEVTGLSVPAKNLKADGGGPLDDMAVYLNHDATPQSQALALAAHTPPVGTPVWVIARVRGGVPEGQILQSGKIIKINDWTIMQFDDDGIITAGASGAPVVDSTGEVIGVYSGHSTQDGHKLGFIIPAPLIAEIINKSSN